MELELEFVPFALLCSVSLPPCCAVLIAAAERHNISFLLLWHLSSALGGSNRPLISAMKTGWMGLVMSFVTWLGALAARRVLLPFLATWRSFHQHLFFLLNPPPAGAATNSKWLKERRDDLERGTTAMYNYKENNINACKPLQLQSKKIRP